MVGCRTLHFFTHFFMVTTYMWMLCEGNLYQNVCLISNDQLKRKQGLTFTIKSYFLNRIVPFCHTDDNILLGTKYFESIIPHWLGLATSACSLLRCDTSIFRTNNFWRKRVSSIISFVFEMRCIMTANLCIVLILILQMFSGLMKRWFWVAG